MLKSLFLADSHVLSRKYFLIVINLSQPEPVQLAASGRLKEDMVLTTPLSISVWIKDTYAYRARQVGLKQRNVGQTGNVNLSLGLEFEWRDVTKRMYFI